MGSRAMKMRPGTRNKRRYLPVLYVFVVLIALAVAGGCAFYAMGESWLQDLPDYQDASAYNLDQKTRVYASDNTTLLAEFYLEDREPVSSLSDISGYVAQGTVATEDVRFYEHDGIDLQGIARAVVNNFTGGETEGASTITQQFVRNTVLSDEAGEQTIKRKVREAYISLKLEQIYSKDDILLMYLNTVNYGSGTYGIEAAARKYFSVDSKDLTLAQAATLVGIPQSPTYNNPIDYPDACLARRNLVLNRMLTNGSINQDQYDAAVAEPLGLNVSNTSNDGIYAYPYFTSYVRQVLLDNYSEAEVFKGGLTVTTTLDVNAQNLAEAAAKKKESEVDDDMEVAMVAIDPDTGYIKALVGGKDYYTDQYNLATQATRSPGSSFKTYTLTAAIENGIDPSTYVNCSSPITIDGWHVENYDGASYGTRSISGAFAISSNTGFARLSTLLTPAKVAEMATRMGVETPLNGYQSITLGAENVTVKDMAQAYATIASGGIKREGVAIEKIVDNNGKIIYQPDTTGTRVISQEVANAAEQVMEGVITSGTGTAARLSTQTAAGKTGTSETWRDSYFCGITPQYSVAIWLGCRQEREMNAAYSATSTFKYFLDPLLKGQANERFPMANAAKPTYRTLTSAEQTILGASSYSSSSNNSSSGSSSGTSSTGASTGASTGTSTTTTTTTTTTTSSSDDGGSSGSSSDGGTGTDGSGTSNSSGSGGTGTSGAGGSAGRTG
jgi:1A family penicillin-binding protein